MKHRIPLSLLITLLLVPGCSAEPAQNLYNSGRFRTYLKQTAPNPSGIALYIRGRVLYELDRYRDAAAVFEKAAAGASPWRDAARYYRGQALAASENRTKALRVFTELYTRGSSPVFTRRALYRAAAMALRLKNWKALAAASLNGLKRVPGSSFFLSRALRATQKSGNRKGMLDTAFRILMKKKYDKLNQRALTVIRKTGCRTQDLSFSKRMLWIEGLIRAGSHGRAIRLLKNTRCATSRNRRERDFNLLWCYRLRRRYRTARALLTKMEKAYRKDRKIRLRILNHRCRLLIRRGQLNSAAGILKKLESLQPGKNASLTRTLSLRAGNSSFAQKWNTLAAKRYPEILFFQKKLIQDIIRCYKRKKYRRALSAAENALHILRRNNLKGQLGFFAAISAARTGRKKTAARFAALVIRSAPYSYYHKELSSALPGLSPKPAPMTAKDGAPETVRKILISGLRNTEIRNKLTSLWKDDPLNRALANPDPDLDRLTAESDRFFFRALCSGGFYRDAFLLLYRSLRDRGRTFLTLNPRQLAAAADLCARAGAYRSQFACLVSLFRKTRWGMEVVRMHSLTGAIPVVEKLYPRLFHKPVIRWSRKRSLDPLFVLSLIRQESAFQHRVTSWAGARGLMQVMPYTAMNIIASRRIHAVNLLQPDQNISIGSSFLGWLKKAYKTDVAVLIGYNAGPNRIRSWERRYRRLYGRYDRWGFVESIPYRETRGYIKAVLSNLAVYKTLYN